MFKTELNEITTGSKKIKKKKIQKKFFKIFIIQDKILLIYLIIIQELSLKPFTKQIEKPQEQDLKYQHLNKCFKDCQ